MGYRIVRELVSDGTATKGAADMTKKNLFLIAGLVMSCVTGASGRASAPSAPVHAPKRIVSLNLCADQLVLALADRSQIAGLTQNADKAGISAAAAQARGLHILGTSAEDILGIDPDLVVGMPARGSSAMSALEGEHYNMLDLRTSDSLDDIYASIREVAVAVGHRERGDALIARMQRDLAALPRPGRGKVAAYYQRRGFLTGTGTLVDDLMNRAGLVNLAARLGKPALSQMTLEEMVAAHPDFIIVESDTDRVVDQGTEMLHHPAIDDIRRISIPQGWTVCGGPAYVLAARILADQLSKP
jgi:iron complex transport system substrate-binding protein